MRKTVLQFLVAASLMGCKEVGLQDENFTHQVENVKVDKYFVVENKSIAASTVSFSIEGELSHDAVILWSDKAPDADTIFTYPNEISLPKGKVNVSSSGDYYSNKLYIKYVSLNDSTAGNVQIKVKI